MNWLLPWLECTIKVSLSFFYLTGVIGFLLQVFEVVGAVSLVLLVVLQKINVWLIKVGLIKDWCHKVDATYWFDVRVCLHSTCVTKWEVARYAQFFRSQVKGHRDVNSIMLDLNLLRIPVWKKKLMLMRQRRNTSTLNGYLCAISLHFFSPFLHASRPFFSAQAANQQNDFSSKIVFI